MKRAIDAKCGCRDSDVAWAVNVKILPDHFQTIDIATKLKETKNISIQIRMISTKDGNDDKY